MHVMWNKCLFYLKYGGRSNASHIINSSWNIEAYQNRFVRMTERTRKKIADNDTQFTLLI